MEERGAGPGKRGTKLQGREGSTESLARLGIGSDREEQEEKTMTGPYRARYAPGRSGGTAWKKKKGMEWRN